MAAVFKMIAEYLSEARDDVSGSWVSAEASWSPPVPSKTVSRDFFKYTRQQRPRNIQCIGCGRWITAMKTHEAVCGKSYLLGGGVSGNARHPLHMAANPFLYTPYTFGALCHDKLLVDLCSSHSVELHFHFSAQTFLRR